MRFDRFIQEALPSIKFIRKHSKREKVLFGEDFSDITYMSFRLIKEILPELIKQGKIELAIFEIVRSKKPNVKQWQIKRLDNYRKLKFFLHIQDQYDNIAKLETKYLYSPPDADLVNAGINKLNVLGDDNLIDNLAQGKIWLWETIKDMPYEKIFTKQLKNTIEREISNNLKKIQENKRKNKRLK